MGRAARFGAAAAVIALLLSLGGGAAHGAFPGQRGKIALTDVDRVSLPTVGNVFTAYEGGGRTRLTNFTRAADPAWSADGAQIAFSVEPTPNGPREIWTMSADGTRQTQVTSGADAGHPAWSPDGTRIAFERRDGVSSTIHVMHANGSNVSELHSGRHPSWSPDGARIAFSDGPVDEEAGLGPQDIWTIGANGAGPVQITAHDRANDSYFFEPDWSPDGSLVAFENTHCPDPETCIGVFDYEVHTIGSTGAGRRLITPAGSVFGNPAWAPDGRDILVEAHVAGGGIGVPRRDELWEVDGGGSFLYKVFSDAAEPGWQPVVGFDGYPRPRGASPIRLSLVPAFADCIDPNTQHGGPMAYDSCGPPVQRSSRVTVGQRSIGSFFAKPLAGDPDTTA